jgi:hypothetical protein
MRTGFTIATLTAGAIAMSAVPAAAQGWGYDGWYGPRGGFGIGIGFGAPYYADWGYAGGYYAAPGAYA